MPNWMWIQTYRVNLRMSRREPLCFPLYELQLKGKDGLKILFLSPLVLFPPSSLAEMDIHKEDSPTDAACLILVIFQNMMKILFSCTEHLLTYCKLMKVHQKLVLIRMLKRKGSSKNITWVVPKDEAFYHSEVKRSQYIKLWKWIIDMLLLLKNKTKHLTYWDLELKI